MHAVCRSVLCVALLLMITGCQRAKSAPTKPTSPSKVTVSEDRLTTVELTEDAEKRLGIETSLVEMRNVPQRRSFGGEITLPTGATVIVQAPITGKLQAPTDRKVPLPGTAVTEKQSVLTLLPVLSPAEKIGIATQLADAEGLIQQAESVVKASRIDLERAEQQVGKGVGLGKTLDDAKAKMVLSEKQLDAAVSRKKVLEMAVLDGGSKGEQKPISIESPQSGILRAIHALPDEIVMAGALLFEIMKTDTIWIRVPVYVGETAEIATDQPAQMGGLAWRPGQELAKAQAIAAPPTATPLSSTVDLYYEMPNPDGKLKPGQRVSVQLPLVGSAEQRVVPWSAVVHDIYGGLWVYEQTAEHTYVRRRVQVKNVVDSLAILDQGPPVGAKIVTIGVAEMFGTEFGNGK